MDYKLYLIYNHKKKVKNHEIYAHASILCAYGVLLYFSFCVYVHINMFW